MNTESRTKNSVRNAILGLVFQIINIICSFIVRTVFIAYLSSSYLGISGLFTNILSLLSLADLGFDTAIIYSLYKPIAEKNENKVASLMNYFKKVYNIIGIIVLISGLLLLPFLDIIINLENDIGNIKIYYVLYLLNTSCTYFLANRVAIINADQKMYIVKRIGFVFSIIQSALQCLVLILYRNFMLFLIIQLICTIMKNIVGAFVAKKMYPFLRKNKSELDKEERKEIINNTKSFMIYKVGGVVLNNTDNILISSLILTEVVGIYSNYTVIIDAFNTMINLIFSASLASIGNLNVKGTHKQKENVLNRIKFMSIWIYGCCSICLLLLLNDFIGIMWGKEYVMGFIIPLAALINFLICGLLHPFRLYRETTAAFKEIKYIYIYTSILNLLLSVLFAWLMPSIELKLFGIIIATAIARLMTNYWFEPKKIYNVVFNKSSKKYFINNVVDILKIILIGFIVFLTIKGINVDSWIMMILKAIICFVLTNILLFLFYKNTDEFKYFIYLERKILKNIKRKKQKV